MTIPSRMSSAVSAVPHACRVASSDRENKMWVMSSLRGGTQSYARMRRARPPGLRERPRTLDKHPVSRRNGADGEITMWAQLLELVETNLRTCSLYPPSSVAHDEATVDVDGLPRYVIRVRPRQVCDQAGDVVRGLGSPEGDARRAPLPGCAHCQALDRGRLAVDLLPHG